MRRAAVLIPVWAWQLLFVGVPMLLVVALSVSVSRLAVPPYTPLLANPDASNWQNLVADTYYLRAALQSLFLATAASALCLALGYPIALAIARSPERWRSPLLLLVMLPFWTGFLLRITAWIGLLRDGGWLDVALAGLGLGPAHLLYTRTAMLLGVTYAYLPFMILPLYARLSRRDPALEEAAADLGAGPLTVFRTVTLPLSVPGVLAGLALVFIPVMGEYVIPDLLGGPSGQTLGRALWDEFFSNRDWPMAATLATAMLVLLLLPAAWLRSRSR